MSKRKREAASAEQTIDSRASKSAKTNGQPHDRSKDPVIQIVTGSYERVLHGLIATVSRSLDDNDSPLFNLQIRFSSMHILQQ